MNLEALTIGTEFQQNLGFGINIFLIRKLGENMYNIIDDDDSSIVNLSTLKKLLNKELPLSEISWN